MKAIADELDHNAEQAELFREHLPRGGVPYPAFDVNGWHLIVQSEVVNAIEARTLRYLARLYNRFRTANEYYALVSDVMFGPSAILAPTAIAHIASSERRVAEEEKFAAHRELMLRRLADRIDELIPHITETRERVSEELNVPPD